ncbi:MAG: hypothetical protein JNL72_02780 [Flavipsychrobacter sp.]|nr:hypothetical protein [Flavipsychrobacter sp.]
MSTSELREKLILYLTKADNKKIKALYTLLEEEIDADRDFVLTDEHIKILEAEREKYLNGTGGSHSWEDVKARIRGKKAS